MNSKALVIIMMTVILSTPAQSGSIYKCTKNDKSVIFTDKACPANTSTTLIHKETEQEIKNRQQEEQISTIKRLIEGNQLGAAKEYAIKNNLSETYYNQLSISSNQKVEAEKQQAQEEKQQQLAIEQQKLALQAQQLAIEKTKAQQQQQTTNSSSYNYPYYSNYGSPYSSPYYSSSFHHINNSNISYPTSFGGITSTVSVGMNPVSSGGMNPPMSFSSPLNPPQPIQFHNDRRR